MSNEVQGVVKQAAGVERRQVAAGTATETQSLIGVEDGAPNFSMRRFIMGPGGGMPRHTNRVEHEQYVLRGRARVGIGTQVYEVGPPYRPEEMWHGNVSVDALRTRLGWVPATSLEDGIRSTVAPQMCRIIGTLSSSANSWCISNRNRR